MSGKKETHSRRVIHCRPRFRHPWVPDLPSPPYLPKGAKGAGVGRQLAPPAAQDGSIEFVRPPARIRPHGSMHRAPVFPLSKAELQSGQCVVTGEANP